MWKFEHTETSAAPPAKIWREWADVAGWPRQNALLESAELKGPFAKGSRIGLRPKKGPASTIEIIEATENRSFVGRGSIPLGELRIEHEVRERSGGGAEFTHRIVLTGPLRGLFVRLFARQMADNLPAMMRTIARLAEER
jgi:hypothetical protein